MCVQLETTSRDVFFGHFLAEEARLLVGCFFLRDLAQLFFELGNAAVLNFARLGQVAAALRPFEFGPRGVEFLFHFGLGVDLRLLVLPFGFHRAGFFFQVGELFFQLRQALLARRVLFFLQRLAFHLELHDLALDHVDLRRHRIELDLQARGRFVDKVDRFVRQKPIADVAMRKDRRRDQRRVLDAHAVMHFVAFLQSAQNRDRVLDARLIHHHRLEAPLQRRVFLDVFAILVERRRADGAQFAARELRLEHVRRVDRAFRRARADDRVQLVDEKNDLPLRVGHFLEERFEPVLEFAAKLRAGDHRADVHRDESLVLERLRHVAGNDAAREPFDDRGFADARARRSAPDCFSCGAKAPA